MSQQRRVQATADAAALATANTLFQKYPAYRGVDQDGQAKLAALALARDNGYTNDGVNSTVTVNIPPTSGNFVAKPGYAKVIVQSNLRGPSAASGDRTRLRSKAGPSPSGGGIISTRGSSCSTPPQAGL